MKSTGSGHYWQDVCVTHGFVRHAAGRMPALRTALSDMLQAGCLRYAPRYSTYCRQDACATDAGHSTGQQVDSCHPSGIIRRARSRNETCHGLGASRVIAAGLVPRPALHPPTPPALFDILCRQDACVTHGFVRHAAGRMPALQMLGIPRVNKLTHDTTLASFVGHGRGTRPAIVFARRASLRQVSYLDLPYIRRRCPADAAGVFRHTLQAGYLRYARLCPTCRRQDACASDAGYATSKEMGHPTEQMGHPDAPWVNKLTHATTLSSLAGHRCRSELPQGFQNTLVDVVPETEGGLVPVGLETIDPLEQLGIVYAVCRVFPLQKVVDDVDIAARLPEQ